MTESLFLPAHTSDEGTLTDIQRWMWMLTAMRRRKWLQLVIGWTANLKLNIKFNINFVEYSFTVCGISNNNLSSQKVMFLYFLTVVEEELVETQLM